MVLGHDDPCGLCIFHLGDWGEVSLGFLGFRWLKIPDSSQVSSLGAAVTNVPVSVKGRSPWQWPVRDSAGAICVALRSSLVKVQAGGCSVLLGYS